MGEDEEDKVAVGVLFSVTPSIATQTHRISVKSDWDEPSADEAPKPVSNAAPPRKKVTLKQKLAEKEAIRQQRIANGEEIEEFMDEREKRLWERQRELEADLVNASDLLGSTTIANTTDSGSPSISSQNALEAGHSSSASLDALLSENPRTKDEFEAFSRKLYNMIIKPHINKPLYAAFVESHVRQLCEPLKDSEVRKAASGLTTLASMKQQEERDKASGKKKPKAAVGIGGVKGPAKCVYPSSRHDLCTDSSVRHDTTHYDEALDDFGNDPDDFM